MCGRGINTTDATLILLLCVGVFLLGVFSFLVIAPYLEEKAFHPANCTIGEVREERRETLTSLKDICVIVKVTYSAYYEEEFIKGRNGTLHLSTDFLYTPCTCTGLENLGEAGMEGNLIPCFFNPNKPSHLLARLHQSFWATVHSALWPSVLILGAVSFFLARRCSPDIKE